MKYLSVCSGIEAATVAWHSLGWTPLAFSEIEPFPRAVLQHHYPDVPLHGDFTVLRDQPWIVDADILVGGTPCQAFSVAGLRNSLSDERGNLSLEFVRLADAIDNVRIGSGRKPAIIVWENVPGVLSVKDNAFGCFLSALAGDDTPYVPPRGKWTNAGVVAGPKRTIAWRVLDAQYFGLAQRRRRVFVVASAGDGFDPAAVLLECEGVRRDTPPRRETGQVAPTIPSRSTAGGGLGTDLDCDGGVITLAHGQGGAEVACERSPTLTCIHEAPIAAYAVPVAPTLRAGGNQTGGDRPPGTDVDTADSLIVAHSLRGEGFDASEDGTGRGTPLVPVEVVGSLSCNTGPNGNDAGNFACNQAVDAGHVLPVVASTLKANNGGGGFGSDPSETFLPVAFSYIDNGADASNDLSPTLRALGAYDANGGGQMAVTYPINTQIALRHKALGERTGMGIGDTDDPAFTLQAGHSHAVAVQASQSGVRFNETVGTLDANYGSRRHNGVMVPVNGGDKPHVLAAIGFYANEGSLGSGNNTEMSPTLKAHPKTSNLAAVATNMAVRRLTPVECERLQGFPDAYTMIPWKKKPPSDCPDGPRYKALGNSMAVPCMRWIGERIQKAV